MKRTMSLLTVLPALMLSASLALAGSTTVIVEMDGDPGAIYKVKQEQQGASVSVDDLQAYRAQVALSQDAILANIAAAGISHQIFTTDVPDYAGGVAGSIAHRYTLVMNGVAITLDQGDIAALDGISGVKQVYPARYLNPSLDKSVAFIRADELYGGIAELTQFDDVREGFEGQGINISVIDSGIEWQHEMFGGDPTPPRLGLLPSSASVPENQKIVYYLPMSDLAVEDGLGHGTHVASTAAGYRGFTAGADNIPLTADDVAVHGVAPQANLMGYAVCADILSSVGAVSGAIGGCLNVLTITAIEDSVSPRTITGFAKPVAHVINMSLGGNFGTPDDATAVAASNAGALGAIVVAAAGNSGDVPGIVGSPSTGRRVISVANATDVGSGAEWYVDVLSASSFGQNTSGGQTPASQFALQPGTPNDVKVFPMAGAPAPPAGSLAQYYVYVAEGTAALLYPPAVSGRIALVRVGGASGAFAETANNAFLAGAAAVLLIGTTENATAVTTPIPAATISPAAAQGLLDLIGPNPANGAISPLPIRLNPAPAQYLAGVAGSSSRGPVAGFAQVKPDLSAPGTNVLAALPPASLLGALEATSHGPNYGAISGTSMATPHIAGVAALVKQANPTWNADEVRTALINTSTPMRDAAGVPEAYGPHNPKIHSQGGGYVDAFAAANVSALMGVRGDGVTLPTLLGSHAFGNQALIGNQCVYDATVPVEIVDKRGQGGTYHISVYDNRNAYLDGIVPFLSTQSVTVPAGGSASFDAGLTFDGTLIDDVSVIEVQWFVVAEKADGSETLSMPMFLRAVPSAPSTSGEAQVTSQDYQGTVGPGSADAGVGENVDIPVEVVGGTLRLLGHLEADLPTNVAFPDFDLELYDPSGTQVASSGNVGGIEDVDVEVSGVGTYIFRIVNYLNVQADFTLTVTQHQVSSGSPADVAAIAGEYTDQSGQALDFDGAYTVHWAGSGGELGYQLERSTDGGAWEILDVVDGNTTSATFSGQSDGSYSFRVRSHFPGITCVYISDPGAASTIVVDLREAVTVTQGVSSSIASGSASGGLWQFNVQLTNNTPAEYLAPLTLSIVAIHASTGDVSVVNADNGGSGSSASPAQFDYSTSLGDERLSGGETSGTRNMVFANPSGQLFTFDAVITAFRKPQ